MLVNSSLCMGRALSYTDYKTTTGFPTLVAPVHVDSHLEFMAQETQLV